MMSWLLEKTIFDSITKASLELIPDSEERMAHAVSVNQRSRLSIKNNIATIKIQGTLTDSPNIIAELFGNGNTTYAELLEDLSSANFDDDVDSILLAIDSPGGEATASWVAVMDAIADSKKPVTAVVGTMAASAAYGIASQAGRILAQNRMSSVGSIGVVAGFLNDNSVIEITSSDAPEKRPDIKTEEGVESVKKQLDAMHDIFVQAIARGRNTTVQNVNQNFGRGAMMLAQDAIDAGMIDNFFSVDKESPLMDIETLRMEHRGVFDAVVAQERDRVCAHLKLGQESGDLKTAIQAVMDGSELTETLKATYLSASMKREDMKARANDDVSINEETSIESKEEEVGNNILKMAAANLGFTLKGVK